MSASSIAGARRESINSLERMVLRVLRARREAFSSQESMSLVLTASPLGWEYWSDRDGGDDIVGTLILMDF